MGFLFNKHLAKRHFQVLTYLLC